MAQKNRTDLTNLVNINIADASDITASEHREVEKDIIDSCFNIKSDDSRDIIYNNEATNATVNEKINENFLSILKKPTRLVVGKVSLNQLFGLNVGQEMSVSSDFSNCIVNSSDINDTLFTVYFTTPLSNSNYTINFEFKSLSGDFRNDTAQTSPVFKNKTSSSFQMGFKSLNTGLTRNLDIILDITETQSL